MKWRKDPQHRLKLMKCRLKLMKCRLRLTQLLASQRKIRRGATKKKHIAKDPTEHQHVDFTDLGDPCGPGSVLLSSYLGPLVRELVPVIIDTWRKFSEEIKTVLWKSIEVIRKKLYI